MIECNGKKKMQSNEALMHPKDQLEAHVLTIGKLKSENTELQSALTQSRLTAKEKTLETEPEMIFHVNNNRTAKQQTFRPAT